MIALDNKSYPYLAISQHYNVPYGEVLRFIESDEACVNDWQIAALNTLQNEMYRRKKNNLK